jgi:hypothetical protein
MQFFLQHIKKKTIVQFNMESFTYLCNFMYKIIYSIKEIYSLYNKIELSMNKQIY